MGGGARGGPGARSDSRNWTGARSAKEKIGRSAERQIKKIGRSAERQMKKIGRSAERQMKKIGWSAERQIKKGSLERWRRKVSARDVL